MNPLLDIITTTGPANPTNAGIGATAPTGEKPDGLFASVLTAVVQQATGQLVDPLTAQIAPGELPALAEPIATTNPAVVAAKPETVPSAASGQNSDQEIPTPPQPSPSLEPQLANLALAAASFNLVQDSSQPMANPAPASELILPQSESELTSAVTALLTPAPTITPNSAPAAQLPADVTITTAEPLSNDELAALIVSSAKAEARPTEAATVAAPRNPAVPLSGQLKSLLQKQFPELNIQSGSGKLAVDVNIKAAANPAPESSAIVAPVQAAVVAGLPMANGYRNVRDIAPKPTARLETAPGNRPAVQILDEAETAATPVTDKVTARVLNTAPKQFEIARLATQAEVAQRDTVPANDFAGCAALPLDKPEAASVSALDETVFTKTPDVERARISVQRIQVETLLKRGEIKLQIQPEHLGMVKIRLMTTPHETTARLETSSEDARRAVELGLPQLRESFERAGLKLSQIEVVVGDDSLSRHSQTFDRNPRQPRSFAKRELAPVAELASHASASSASVGAAGLLSGLNLLA